MFYLPILHILDSDKEIVTTVNHPDRTEHHKEKLEIITISQYI